jgi:hypothetical protein
MGSGVATLNLVKVHVSDRDREISPVAMDMALVEVDVVGCQAGLWPLAREPSLESDEPSIEPDEPSLEPDEPSHEPDSGRSSLLSRARLGSSFSSPTKLSREPAWLGSISLVLAA